MNDILKRSIVSMVDNWGQSKIKLEQPPFKPSHIKGFGGCSVHFASSPTSNSSA